MFVNVIIHRKRGDVQNTNVRNTRLSDFGRFCPGQNVDCVRRVRNCLTIISVSPDRRQLLLCRGSPDDREPHFAPNDLQIFDKGRPPCSARITSSSAELYGQSSEPIVANCGTKCPSRRPVSSTTSTGTARFSSWVVNGGPILQTRRGQENWMTKRSGGQQIFLSAHFFFPLIAAKRPPRPGAVPDEAERVSR